MKRIQFLLLILFFIFSAKYLMTAEVYAANEPSAAVAQNKPQKSNKNFFWKNQSRKTQEVSEKPVETEKLKLPVENKNGPVTLVGSNASSRPENVAAINQQLQNIIRMNDVMKANQAAKIAEIQAIQEQARIHQQILRNLESSRKVAPVFNPSDVQEVLRQEKIRLISEQTTRNSEIVKALDRRRS